MLHHKKILFVHIPKTGGTSITKFLREKNFDNWHRTSHESNHDSLFLLESRNDISKTFKFSVVRNPYKRAYSHYIHAKKQKSINLSFNEFINLKRFNGNMLLLGYPIDVQLLFLTKFPLIPFTQTFYLQNQEGDISIDKIYKTENLQQFEIDFKTTLPVLNKGSYTREDYISAYTKTNINLIKNLFTEDFQNFNYSSHFDDSI